MPRDLRAHPYDIRDDSRRIINFRNILVHGYATVSDEVVWGVLEQNLPTLRQKVAALLK